jgi:hypothetical protein
MGLVLEALELLLDALVEPPGTDTGGGVPEPALQARAAWADLVLRRAFASLDETGPPPYEGRGPEETLRTGARTWSGLEQAENGREAALAIAGLSADELRAALLAAVHERVRETRRPEDATKWIEAMSAFTEWWRPQDLL